MGKRFGIIGGGIAGLSMGYFLGDDAEVLEKEAISGGLCRSFKHEGFGYDIGGHVLFSRDSDVVELVLSLLNDNVAAHRRKNAIWYRGNLVKYPFENGLAALPVEERFQCVRDFIEAPGAGGSGDGLNRSANLQDWILKTFGSSIAEKYLLPYNEKIWKMAPSQMSADWVERIPKPPVEDVLKSALGIETEGYVHQLNFYYPSTGGFESIPRAFEAASHATTIKNFHALHVQRSSRQWTVSDGKQERSYDSLISTIPTGCLLAALENVPDDVRRASDSLVCNSMIVVMLGVNAKNHLGTFGVYFPQKRSLFHRICFYDFLGQSYAPSGTSSILAEITTRQGLEAWSMSDAQLADRVIADLEREGFIRRSDVIATEVRRIPFAYVVQDIDYKRNVAIIRNFCNSSDIELCGRFAEFRYLNSDGVIRSAWDKSEKLKTAPR